MSNNLIKWTPKIKVWFWDVNGENDFLIINADLRNKLENDINNLKTIKIDSEGVTFATNRFIKIEEMNKVKNNVEAFIFNQAPYVRKFLLEIQKERREKIARNFETVEELKAYISKKFPKNIPEYREY